MLEQEVAGVIKFMLDKANNPAPYYYKIPQSFVVPAIYFPAPEIETNGETFATYTMRYTMFVNFFHKTTQAAYALALLVITALKSRKNLVPIIDMNGKPSGKNIRINDPSLSTIDDGAVQLKISWVSHRPYDRLEVMKMQIYYIDGWDKAELYKEKIVSEAIEKKIEKYIKD